LSLLSRKRRPANRLSTGGSAPVFHACEEGQQIRLGAWGLSGEISAGYYYPEAEEGKSVKAVNRQS
jgi:hypothetical protein